MRSNHPQSHMPGSWTMPEVLQRAIIQAVILMLPLTSSLAFLHPEVMLAPEPAVFDLYDRITTSSSKDLVHNQWSTRKMHYFSKLRMLHDLQKEALLSNNLCEGKKHPQQGLLDSQYLSTRNRESDEEDCTKQLQLGREMHEIMSVKSRFLQSTANDSFTGPPDASQLEALLSISSAFSTYTDFATWTTDNPCGSWVGLKCDNDGLVVSLDLRRSNCTGTIPSEISNLTRLQTLNLEYNNLFGSIPSSLGSLSQLKYLYLSDNSLSGSIPSSLGNLTSLELLDFSNNSLSGPIPSSLGNLTSLFLLDLSYNSLSGPIPSSLGNLSLLSGMTLESNNLTGSIPSSLGSLSQLEILGLSTNSLSGSIPSSLGNLNSLQFLVIGSTNLTGSIPSSFGNLTSLTFLVLSNNALTGTLPDSFINLRNVTFIDLSRNQLSGPFPSVLLNMPSIQMLALQDNYINGTLPGNLGDLVNLTFFTIAQNYLTGYIPSSITQIADLSHFAVNSNFLSGDFPTFLGSMSSLEFLGLGTNNFTGQIPENIGFLPRLVTASLFSNQFSGELPASIGNLSQIDYFNVEFNNISGGIPDTIGNMKYMTYLSLGNNNFEGSIPESIGNLNNLQYLTLENNKLTGNIPSSIGNLSSLTYFSLSNNLVRGYIPEEIGQIPLQTLQLDNNMLDSTLPPAIGNLTDIKLLKLNNNSFYGSLPESYTTNLTNLQQLSLSGCSLSKTIYPLTNLSALLSLDLSSNYFEGNLPLLPTSGNLFSINLQSNRFTGNILLPGANISRLQALLLDNNALYGEVPSFSAAVNLTILSLSNNNLSGTIPGALLTKPDIRLQLYGNADICTATNQGTNANLNISCQPPSALTYQHASNCTTLECNNNNTANPLLTDSCQCAAPLTAVLSLTSPPFAVFTAVQDTQMRTQMGSKIGVDPAIIFISKAAPAYGTAEVTVQFFSITNVLSFEVASVVTKTITNATFLKTMFDEFLGPATLLSITPPPPLSTFVPGSSPPGLVTGGSKKFPTVAIIVISVGAVSVVFLIVVLLYFKLWPKSEFERQTSFDKLVREHFARPLILEVVKNATNNFSENKKLGEGGYGIVYQGVGPNGDHWAVKRAKQISLRGLEEFQNEVNIISRMAHTNILALRAYCHEDGEQILIYDYMSQGNLRAKLQCKGDTDPLNFEQRLEIAIGAAEGLRYLHHYAKPKIIHRDVKSENILLDENLQARVADFGLLKDDKKDEEGQHSTKKVAGTPGYIDPEYYTTSQVTTKSDVYSFGVVLLEVISGKGAQVVDKKSDPMDPTIVSLVEFTQQHVKGNVSKLADPLLEGNYPRIAMKKLLELALDCVVRSGANRPSMEDVARRLSHIKDSLKEIKPEDYVDEDTATDDEFGNSSFVIMEPSFSTVTGSETTGSMFDAPVSRWEVR